MTDKAMTDERLIKLEQYANSNNYNQDRLAEACREIRRLRQEVDQREVDRLEALVGRSRENAVVLMNELLKQAKETIRKDHELLQVILCSLVSREKTDEVEDLLIPQIRARLEES